MRRVIQTSCAVILAFNLSGCAEWFIDAELEKLCKANGGIKVFETVKLPADQFRPDGYPVFFRDKESGSTEENWLGPEFRIEFRSSEVNRVLWVKLTTSTTTIRRVQDQKIFGQLTKYYREGGGVPLSEGAGKVCPANETNLWKLIGAIFVNTSKGANK